jgi:hypothetical protein
MQSAECGMAKKKANHSEFQIYQGPIGPPSNCGMSIAECGLKKKTPKSEIRNSKSEIQWADAFCAQCPYPRATTQVSRKCQTL